jgi:AcrR family transcriptional regulator
VGYKRIPTARSATTAAARREHILDEASVLFEHRGYYGTSLRMIAREAGITPSLLQKYFPSKEDVLAAFVDRALADIDTFTASVQRAVATLPDSRAMMSAVAYNYMDFLDHMRGFYLTWIMCPELVAPYRESLPAFITINHDVLTMALSRRLKIGREVARLRVRIFFSSLFTCVMYYGRVAEKYASSERREERVSRLLDALIGGETSAELALIG